MRRILSVAILVVAVAACSPDGGSSSNFNEDAARDAAIANNPGDTDGVDEWVDSAREICTDDEQAAEWIESSQDYAESEAVEIYTAGCAETLADVARDLALPVPTG